MKKKPYVKPEIKKFGTVRDLTQAKSKGAKTDGGAFPLNKMTCITAAPQIEEHRSLLMDEGTQTRFREQIARIVKPGDVVLDLGTGTGLHAFFACKAGAKKVYAIDSEAIIEIAREAAHKNGLTDQIEFVMTDAADLELIEKVDVIITNIGFLNTLETLPSIARKHLKAGGRLIPSALELQFTLVNAPDQHSERIGFWENDRHGFDFSAFRMLASNHPLYTEFTPDQLLAEPQSLGRVDLQTLHDDFIESEVRMVPSEDGIAHGFGGWYNFWSGGELMMSTKPPLRLHKDIWTEIFLPFNEPFRLLKGQELRCRIGMFARGGLNGPFWRWQVWKDTQQIVDQCSFYATPLSPKILEKIALAGD